MLHIFVPVYNEEEVLRESILGLDNFLKNNFNKKYKIYIVDGASIDKTAEIGKVLEKELTPVDYINTGIKGKGGQLKKAALSIEGDNFIFIDADMPIQLHEFLLIVNSLLNKEADLVIASRHLEGHNKKRAPHRRIISHIYGIIIKRFFKGEISDSIAGCKAWNYKIKQDVWPNVKDTQWFFDTELIYHTLEKGYSTKEIAVSYRDNRKSRLNVIKDGFKILRGLMKLK